MLLLRVRFKGVATDEIYHLVFAGGWCNAGGVLATSALSGVSLEAFGLLRSVHSHASLWLSWWRWTSVHVNVSSLTTPAPRLGTSGRQPWICSLSLAASWNLLLAPLWTQTSPKCAVLDSCILGYRAGHFGGSFCLMTLNRSRLASTRPVQQRDSLFICSRGKILSSSPSQTGPGPPQNVNYYVRARTAFLLLVT